MSFLSVLPIMADSTFDPASVSSTRQSAAASCRRQMGVRNDVSRECQIGLVSDGCQICHSSVHKTHALYNDMSKW